jgi:YHS domain
MNWNCPDGSPIQPLPDPAAPEDFPMPRWLAAGLLTAAVITSAAFARADDESPADQAKAALQALNDYIGTWNATGGPDRPGARPAAGDSWSETLSWSWRFTKGEPSIVFAVKNGKLYRGGEIRFDAARKAYELTLTDAKGQKAVYHGQLQRGYLTFEGKDAAGATRQVRMNLAGDNARLVYSVAEKPAGRTIFTRLYTVAGTKEGESLGAAAKDRECVVTGGLGTIAVSYNGKTYYVCCTGCRDAFLESPEKFVKAYEAKKAGK